MGVIIDKVVACEMKYSTSVFKINTFCELKHRSFIFVQHCKPIFNSNALEFGINVTVSANLILKRNESVLERKADHNK